MTFNLVFKGNNIHTNCIVKDHEGWPPIGPINYVDDLMSYEYFIHPLSKIF